MLFSYLSMLFITRFYGAEEWGLYSLCFTVLSIAVIIPVFGFDNALVRILTELNITNNKKETLKVIAKASLLTIAISTGIILGMDYFSEFITYSILNQEGFEPFLALIRIAILPMAFLIIISAIFQSFKKIIQFMMFKSALLSFFFLTLLCCFYIFEIEAKIFEIYVYAILAALTVACIAVIFLFKKTKHEPSNTPKSFSYKNLILQIFLN